MIEWKGASIKQVT